MPKPGTWRLLLLLLLPACEAVAAEPRESLWTRALRLYKQGRHEQACPLFEQVVRKAPGNGTAWADLGLCEARRGRAPEAIRANLEAVRLGNRRTRLNAYFNLDALGVRQPLPRADDAHSFSWLACGELSLPEPLRCGHPLWACTDFHAPLGSMGGVTGTVAMFGPHGEWAREIERREGFYPGDDFGPGIVYLSSVETCFQWKCRAHNPWWSCGSSSLVRERASACFEKQTSRKPRLGMRCIASDCSDQDVDFVCEEAPEVCQAQGDIWDRCHQEACLAAMDALDGNKARWPEVLEEKQANNTACDECVDKDATTCEVIVADACNQRIGYVCWKDEAPRKTRTLQELVLERPEP